MFILNCDKCLRRSVVIWWIFHKSFYSLFYYLYVWMQRYLDPGIMFVINLYLYFNKRFKKLFLFVINFDLNFKKLNFFVWSERNNFSGDLRRQHRSLHHRNWSSLLCRTILVKHAFIEVFTDWIFFNTLHVLYNHIVEILSTK